MELFTAALVTGALLLWFVYLCCSSTITIIQWHRRSLTVQVLASQANEDDKQADGLESRGLHSKLAVYTIQCTVCSLIETDTGKIAQTRNELEITSICSTCHDRRLDANLRDDEGTANKIPECDGDIALCGICLSEYTAGEEAAYSQNRECVHTFHKTCIEGWLKQSRQCPVCRYDFLM